MLANTVLQADQGWLSVAKFLDVPHEDRDDDRLVSILDEP